MGHSPSLHSRQHYRALWYMSRKSHLTLLTSGNVAMEENNYKEISSITSTDAAAPAGQQMNPESSQDNVHLERKTSNGLNA